MFQMHWYIAIAAKHAEGMSLRYDDSLYNPDFGWPFWVLSLMGGDSIKLISPIVAEINHRIPTKHNAFGGLFIWTFG